MYPTAFVLHPDSGRHDTGWGHPEHQGRLPAVVNAVYRDTPTLIDAVLQREVDLAEERELRRVHTASHIESVRSAAERAAAEGQQVYLDSDTVVSGASWEAALGAVGCAVGATKLVLDGEAATAFACARPPGHHATAGHAMGFCLFNNIAVAARWAQAERGVGRVLIVDLDVHHGNGTQDIFYEDGDVYFLSLHLSPHYPGTGASDERGKGAGAGTTRNVPLRRDTSVQAYHAAFDEALDVALSEARPELILLSAGFDCLAGDPLGGLPLQPEDLHALATRLIEGARATAGGHVVAVLEGGYVPDRMGAGVVSVLRAFAGIPQGA